MKTLIMGAFGGKNVIKVMREKIEAKVLIVYRIWDEVSKRAV
jgi:hypothetical protein